ncbi:hypothetical protein QM012_000416 [Aureobasidium pullulans]|uniref:Uncharacterized protein n=1 Tax=Aureobasidium pullulans TaxID=5580 RepID=A0ABR0TVS7_AURPU
MPTEDNYPYVEFRGRPNARRRPSYTGKVLDKGWTPPSSGAVAATQGFSATVEGFSSLMKLYEGLIRLN